MQLRNENIFKRTWLFIAAFFALIVYVFSCFLIYTDGGAKENFRDQFPFCFHSGNFYLAHAKWLRYREHNPAEVDYLFRTAILRKPADADFLHAYFSYLVEKKCCPQRTITLIQEVVKRNPHKAGYNFQAANYLIDDRSEEHTSELQSQSNLVCRLL